MPRAYCPRCVTAYYATTITDNGPVCEHCIARGDIVVLVPSTARRFSRATVNAGGRCDNVWLAGTPIDRA